MFKYEFKDWHGTETRKPPVTQSMRQKLAAEIAKRLSNAVRKHRRDSGTSREELVPDINFKIDALDADSIWCNTVWH